MKTSLLSQEEREALEFIYHTGRTFPNGDMPDMENIDLRNRGYLIEVNNEFKREESAKGEAIAKTLGMMPDNEGLYHIVGKKVTSQELYFEIKACFDERIILE